ncbi:MAG: hypothetical protein E6Q27_02105 [Aeromicrobium sp.]|nr:MAG: hypothetical protein E6Q27_02105 [Aeromicrobium sp.]
MGSASQWLVSLAGDMNRVAGAVLDSLSASELLQMRPVIAGLRRSLDALDHRVIAVGARKDLHRAAGSSSISELIATTNGAMATSRGSRSPRRWPSCEASRAGLV